MAQRPALPTRPESLQLALRRKPESDRVTWTEPSRRGNGRPVLRDDDIAPLENPKRRHGVEPPAELRQLGLVTCEPLPDADVYAVTQLVEAQPTVGHALHGPPKLDARQPLTPLAEVTSLGGVESLA